MDKKENLYLYSLIERGSLENPSYFYRIYDKNFSFGKVGDFDGIFYSGKTLEFKEELNSICVSLEDKLDFEKNYSGNFKSFKSKKIN